MDKLVLVLLESSVALLLFYLVYYFGLRKETFFKANRFYLLWSVVASLSIPWINLNFSSSISNNQIFYNVLETVTVNAIGYEQSLISAITTFQWIAIIYIAGVIAMLLILVIKLFKITRIDKFAVANAAFDLPKNVKLISADVTPFSFLKNIYINPTIYTPKELKEIIMHEQVHINQQHTYDCLFYELLIVFFWFHPIVYKYRTSARELHEFLADEGAIRSGISGVEYQQLLLNQATGLKTLTLANSFNYSLVKRRLIMLTKIKSSRIARVRLLYVLPVLGALVLAFACNDEKQESPIKDIKESFMLDGNSQTNTKAVKDSQGLIISEEIQENSNKENGDVYITAEKMPEFPGGDWELRKFIASNIKYPKEAVEKGISGRVFISFVVNTEGSVENVQIAKGVDPLLDEEAIRVVSALPEWIPGEEKGEKVNVSFTIPINFKLN